jgi:hypothetical protein
MKYLISIIFLFSAAASADSYEQGPFTVSQLRFGGTGIHFSLAPAPAACGGGDQYGMHLKLDAATENYRNEMTSSLLAAYTAGIKLSRIWVRNEGVCSGSHIATAYLLEYEKK